MKFEEKLIFPSGEISNFRIPSLITTNRGTVLAFCNDRKGTLDDHAEVASLCLVRKEAGKDWEELRELCTLDGYHFLIGCAVYDKNTDTAMIFAEILGASVNEWRDYSKEELVAEIGACGLLTLLGIETPSSFTNSAAYIQSWLKVLRNDKKLIVSASSKAEKAINYIFNGKETEAA